MNGYRALRERAAWIDLSDRGKIRVTGEDRARLLHALCTNDVEGVKPGQTVYAFFLNEKGRILADAYIHNLGDELWLDTEPELRTKLMEHLDRYIIADDVTLVDETETIACLGIEGPKASELTPQAQLTTEATFTGQPAVRLFCSAAAKPDVIGQLAQMNVPEATHQEAEIVRLESGKPRYGTDISDKYLVQETQVTNAVHPNKGCYLGQEIVERVRSQGQVHRLLTRLRIGGYTVFAHGTKLISNGTEIGEITSAAYSPAFEEVVALGYLRRSVMESTSPVLVAAAEPPAIVRFAHS